MRFFHSNDEHCFNSGIMLQLLREAEGVPIMIAVTTPIGGVMLQVWFYLYTRISVFPHHCCQWMPYRKSFDCNKFHSSLIWHIQMYRALGMRGNVDLG